MPVVCLQVARVQSLSSISHRNVTVFPLHRPRLCKLSWTTPADQPGSSASFRMMMASSSFSYMFSLRQSNWNASCGSVNAACLSNYSRLPCGLQLLLLRCNHHNRSYSCSRTAQLHRGSAPMATTCSREQAMSMCAALISLARPWTHQV